VALAEASIDVRADIVTVSDQWTRFESTGGIVAFAPLAGGWTRVTLRLEYRPEDLAEPAGQALGIMQHQVSQDLQNFKDVVEDRVGTGGEQRRMAS